MNQVTTKSPAGLPAGAAQFKAALSQARAVMPTSGGATLLRMLKDGAWVYGQEDNSLAAGTEIALNPMSFEHGFSCWTDKPASEGKNEQLGEQMVPFSQPLPDVNTLQQFATPWRQQRSVGVKVVSEGRHKGVEVVYKTTSDGGLRAITSLMDAILARLETDDAAFFVPIVKLGSESYQHPKWGRTYKPVLEIVGWADIDGNEDLDEGDDGGPVEVDKQLTQAAQPPVETKAAEPEPQKVAETVAAQTEATAPATGGRRRRL